MALQETMKALSDPVRRQILVLLREGELPAPPAKVKNRGPCL